MGVRGLTTYAESRSSRVFGPRRLRDCSVVIDASGLAARLHEARRARDRHSGDYAAFARDLDLFLDALKECDVRATLVCDGGRPAFKRRAAAERLEARTRAALDARRREAFPLLLRDVVAERARARNLPIVACRDEADARIAALALETGAFVLAYDSDFFCYADGVRYVPFDRIDLRPRRPPPPDEPYLECEAYEPDLRPRAFGPPQETMALAAALLGNDRVPRSTFAAFVDALSRDDAASTRVGAVLRWLRDRRFDEAAEAALAFYPPSSRPDLARSVRRTRRDYSPRPPSTSGPASSEDESPPRGAPRAAAWALELLDATLVSPRYRDALASRTFYGSPQLEAASRPDAHAPSLPIVRYCYDLMTGFADDGDLTYVGRKGRRVASVRLGRAVGPPPGHDPARRPTATALFHLFEASGRGEFVARLKQVPEAARTPLAACAWTLAASDAAFERVHSLALVALLAVRRRRRNPKARFRATRDEPDERELHALAEFQACLQQMTALNAIAGFPLGTTRVSDAFDGAFVHDLSRELRRSNDPRALLEKLFEKAPDVARYALFLDDCIGEVKKNGGDEAASVSTRLFAFAVTSILFFFVVVMFALYVS